MRAATPSQLSGLCGGTDAATSALVRPDPTGGGSAYRVQVFTHLSSTYKEDLRQRFATRRGALVTCRKWMSQVGAERSAPVWCSPPCRRRRQQADGCRPLPAQRTVCWTRCYRAWLPNARLLGQETGTRTCSVLCPSSELPRFPGELVANQPYLCKAAQSDCHRNVQLHVMRPYRRATSARSARPGTRSRASDRPRCFA